jgi:hypothetical protein
MEIDLNKIKWLKMKSRCEFHNKPIEGEFLHVIVYSDQNPRGILKEATLKLKSYFLKHYYDYSRTPEDGDTGRIFNQNNLDEAVKYAKEMILEAKSKPIPSGLLNKTWYTVYDPVTRHTKPFDCIGKAYQFHLQHYQNRPSK